MNKEEWLKKTTMYMESKKHVAPTLSDLKKVFKIEEMIIETPNNKKLVYKDKDYDFNNMTNGEQILFAQNESLKEFNMLSR